MKYIHENVKKERSDSFLVLDKLDLETARFCLLVKKYHLCIRYNCIR